MRCFWPDPSEHLFLGNPLQKLTPIYSQKSSEKVFSSFCTPQKMWKRKRGFIILLTEQLYSPPIYDQYSLPQKTLRRQRALQKISSTGERGQNTIKEKHHIQDRTLVKGQEVKSFGPFALQNQPQTCQLCIAKCVEVPPWKKSQSLPMKWYHTSHGHLLSS